MADEAALTAPADCPDPSVHGNPFRYCPNCTWTERSEIEPPTIWAKDGQVTVKLSFGPTLVVQAAENNSGFEVAIFKGGIDGRPLAGLTMTFDSQIRPKLERLAVDLDG